MNTAAFLPVSTSRLQEIQQATEDDENLQALKAIILRGWPDDRSQLPEQATPYFSMRDELSLHDGVIFCGQRIVVPVSLRKGLKTKTTWHTLAQKAVYEEHGKPYSGRT